MEDCFFCEYEVSESLYESEYFYVHLDEYPVNPGHLVIVPKRHVESIFDLNQAQWNALLEVIEDSKGLIVESNLKRIYMEVKDKTSDSKKKNYCQDVLNHGNIDDDPEGFNIGVNEGVVAGQTVEHVHIHVIPRYSDDMDNSVGGVRNIFPGKGDYRT